MLKKLQFFTVLAVLFSVAASAKEFKAALLTQGSATESGWNRIAYDGLKRIESELGASVSNVELDADPASYEKAFGDYASAGYKLIVGHGFQFGDAALAVGTSYPDTTFLVTSSPVYSGNVVGVSINTYQPFYLIGVIAGKRSDKVGYIGGVEIPPITQAATGFRNGVRHVKPDIKILEVMTGSWSDLAVAKEAALGMIASGVKMIVPNANVASLGVFQALSEAGPEISGFGTFGNYTEKAPRNLVGNYNPNLGHGLVQIAKEVRTGTFAPGKAIVFGLESPDIVKLIFNDRAANPVSPELHKELDEITTKLISGEIDPTVK